MLYVSFIDLTKELDSVDRTFSWTVLGLFGVPQKIISVIHELHDCVRLEAEVCSGWFLVEQGLRQGYVHAHLLFNFIFAVVINVAYTCFKADKDIVDSLVHLKKKIEAGGRGKATATELVLATLIWGMLYADDAGVVSQSPEQLMKRMRAIMFLYATFGLTALEAWSRSCTHVQRGCRSPPPCLA